MIEIKYIVKAESMILHVIEGIEIYDNDITCWCLSLNPTFLDTLAEARELVIEVLKNKGINKVEIINVKERT